MHDALNGYCHRLEEANRRVALDLLEERHFPGEIVARVLLEAGVVVVRLVPDVVTRGGGALMAAFPRAMHRRVAAFQHQHVGVRPMRGYVRCGELRQHAILGGERDRGRLADAMERFVYARAELPPRPPRDAV